LKAKKEQKAAAVKEPDLLRAIRALAELDAYQYRRLWELYKRDSLIGSLSLRACELEAALDAANARIRELEGENNAGATL
jgi:hypothetical protein